MCIVRGCTNEPAGLIHRAAGFVEVGMNEVMCRPCYEMITTGRPGHGTTFVHGAAADLATVAQLINARLVALSAERSDG